MNLLISQNSQEAKRKLVSVARESGLLSEHSYPFHFCPPGPSQGQGGVGTFDQSSFGITLVIDPN